MCGSVWLCGRCGLFGRPHDGGMLRVTRPLMGLPPFVLGCDSGLAMPRLLLLAREPRLKHASHNLRVTLHLGKNLVGG